MPTLRDQQYGSRLDQLRAYRRLPRGWDTYGGEPCCDRAWQFAVRVLKLLRERSALPFPDMQPISTGVYMEWGDPGNRVYLEVDSDSVVAVRRKCGEHIGGYDDPDYAVERAVRFVSQSLGDTAASTATTGGSLMALGPTWLRVYVAGAYSADNVMGVLANMRRGINMSTAVLQAGFAPFCPWLDYHFVLTASHLTVQDMHDYSAAWLRAADVVLVIPEGAATSRGTQAEIRLAGQLGIPVVNSLEELKTWARKQAKTLPISPFAEERLGHWMRPVTVEWEEERKT